MVIRTSSEKHRRRANRNSRGDRDLGDRPKTETSNLEDRLDDFLGGFIMGMQDWLDREKGKRAYGRRSRRASSWREHDASASRDHYEYSGEAGRSRSRQDEGAIEAETGEDVRDRGRYHSRKRGSRGYPRHFRRRRGHLYRDRSQKKIAGVCAGIAGYLDKEVWKVRFMALIGLFVIPTVVFTSYWILYFILDDKPFYKQVTDSYPDPSVAVTGASKQEQGAAEAKQPLNHAHTLRRVKQLFAANEEKLQTLEAFITSPRFELNRAFQEMDTKE